MKINFSLIALAIGAFGIGTTEFSPMGMLPIIAKGVNVSIPVAGILISAYAIGVMVSAPLMTLLLARQAYRKVLIFLMAIFTLGNLLSAVAPNYTFLLLSRILTSLNHGAFFGLGAVVAASVVPKEKQSAALATMFMGLTIANIGGVPAATWIGDIIGWRMAFLAIAGLGVIAMLALWFFLPQINAKRTLNVRQELSVLIRPQVLIALLTTVLGASSMFTLYTYIAPLLQTLTHATPKLVASLLVLVGIGFSIGNYLGGKFADLSIDRTLKGFLLLMIIIMLSFPFLARTAFGAGLAMLIWGAANFAIVPPLQMQVMRVASEAPALTSSVNIGAFNLGNALGAAAGGAVISCGLGYAMVPIAGAIVALFALIFVITNKPSSDWS